MEPNPYEAPREANDLGPAAGDDDPEVVSFVSLVGAVVVAMVLAFITLVVSG